jgi:hypothetical protein
MEAATSYRYIVRNAADSGKPLIEFLDLPENRKFITSLIQAFTVINFEVINYDDLWMNDEIIIKANSSLGEFSIFRDAKDYYFIASDNLDSILKLDKLLAQNNLFERVI